MDKLTLILLAAAGGAIVATTGIILVSRNTNMLDGILGSGGLEKVDIKGMSKAEQKDLLEKLIKEGNLTDATKAKAIALVEDITDIVKEEAKKAEEAKKEEAKKEKKEKKETKK